MALARNDRNAAMAFARAALADAQAAGLAEVTCRALWLIGRVERGRDTAAASRGLRGGLRVRHAPRPGGLPARSLLELGTIDMFETLATGRLEEARREALAAGALSTAAMVDLHLAGDLQLSAARRTRRWRRRPAARRCRAGSAWPRCR